MSKLLLLIGLGIIAWLIWRGQRTSRQGRLADLTGARALLGVREGASRDEILRAHRILIADVHPDRGGMSDLATRANAARDLLLKTVDRGLS